MPPSFPAVPQARAGALVRPRVAQLPEELWLRIVFQVDDRALAWFVLRRVSRMLRRITEDVFSNEIIRRKCSIRFAGDYARAIFYKTWTINDVTDFVGSWHDPDWGDITPLCDQFPTIIFKPNPRAPASVEARVVLQLQDDPADYEGQYGVVLAEARRELDDEQSEQDEQDEQIMMPDEPIPLGYSFFLRRQCCFCPDLIQAVADVAQCDCLAELFFNAFDWHVKEDCLADGYHLVRIDDKLKPLKIPSIALDMDNLELSFNWLSLCQSFYLDELKLRRIARPWMRYLSVDHSSGRLMVHWQGSLHYPGFFEGFTKRDLLQACKEDGWIFWDRRLNYESLFHPLECKE